LWEIWEILESLENDGNKVLNKSCGKLEKADYMLLIENSPLLQGRIMKAVDERIFSVSSGALWSTVENILEDGSENNVLREALKEYCKGHMLKSGEYFFAVRDYLRDRLDLLGNDRDGIITLERLKGAKLKDLAARFGITSKAVRQAVNRTLRNRIPYVMEDYYASVTTAFNVGRKEFYSVFPDADPMAYLYLAGRYGLRRKDKPEISRQSLKEYKGLFKEELEAYLK
jgi:hypothetical protein